MGEVGNTDMVIPLDKVQSAVALGFDSDTDRIYWTDVEANSISRSYLNGTQQETVINTNLGECLFKLFSCKHTYIIHNNP